jgi:twitching motility protein PilT
MPGSTAQTILIDKLFSVALEKKATDIHLMAGNYPIFRVGSQLNILADQKVLTVDTMTALADSLLSEHQKQRLTVEKEVRTVYEWADRARFRTVAFYQQGYPAFTFRLIPSEIPDPTQQQLPEVLLKKVLHKQGLIIISGPFNSGRTSTVASILQHMNQNFSKRIVSLEHPIEYLMTNSKSMVVQRQIRRDTPSFIKGIKDVVDDDVDIVAVSEMTENGVQELILTLVESGKIVIAVMNAISAISALEKFIDSVSRDKRKWAKDLLAEMLLAVTNQRLVPGIGGGYILAVEVLTMVPAVASIINDENYSRR